jgi:hypothetical protein
MCRAHAVPRDPILAVHSEGYGNRKPLNIAPRLCAPLELLAANPLAVCAVQVLRFPD